MQRFLLALFSVSFVVALASCSRQEEVPVNDNEPPPDETVEDVVIESYINRSYISLLGRKPDPAETSAGFNLLRQNNLSQADREAFLNTLFVQPAFHIRQFDQARSLYLNGNDTTAINDELFVLNVILQDPNQVLIHDRAQAEKDKLLDLLEVPDDLIAGNIDIVEMHRRFVYNLVYDNINMGTQNFVVSLFQNFLFRYPTAQELEAGERMVDGFSSTIFLTNGRTKEDFIAIFLGSSDYYEGQVRDVFTRYLYREPTTEEMESLSVAYKTSGDYDALLRSALSTDEFVGL